MEVAVQKEWLDRWYGYMKNQQQEQADTQKRKIDENFDELTDPELKKLYKLLMVRYYLMYEDLDNATLELAETGLEEDKYHWLNYYYYFFRGIYHYEKREYPTAIDFYNKARLFISEIPIEETAELYYKLASACTMSYQISLSIKYAERALEVFKNKSHYKRISGCESLLGLNNHEIEQYKEAERCYRDALIHVEKIDDKILKLRILHNLGHLYSDQNKPEKALEYLIQVSEFLDLQNDSLKDDYLRVQNLYLMTRNYFKTDQKEKAKDTLHIGHILSKNLDNQDYWQHFNIIKAKFLQSDLFVKVYKEGISYFNEHRLWEYVDQYGEELAFYYRGTENHKEAADYFYLAAEARNQIKKERMVYDD